MSEQTMFDIFNEYLNYEPETGKLFWKKKTSNRVKKIGDECTAVNTHGYKIVRLFNKLYTQHRIAWLLFYKKLPSYFIDHINGNRIDNRITNLREANYTLNAQNHGISNVNTSGKIGVSYCNYYNKYVSYIDVLGKRKNLGYNSTLEKAIKVRKEAELKFFGFETRG